MATNQRAYAFILRPSSSHSFELLGFKAKESEAHKAFHIPGGGVDPGETPTEGVIREIYEESGLTDLRLIKYIGQSVEQFSDETYQRHYFHFLAPQSVPHHWDHHVTGTGADTGLMYSYTWLSFDELLKIHPTYLPYLNHRHLPELFQDNAMLGISDNQLYFLPYQEKWESIFLAEKDLLHTQLNPQYFNIQHIGSTSIPGMCAQPIIDIAVGFSQKVKNEELIEKLSWLGYQKASETKERLTFTKKQGAHNTFQLLCGSQNNTYFESILSWRHHLKTNERLHQEFFKQKLEAWRANANDPLAYQREKTSFLDKQMNSL